MRRIRRLIRDRSGYTLVELTIVVALLGMILAGIMNAFVDGSRAELDTNRRVQAQIQANIAFDMLRKDVHCSISATAVTNGLALTGQSGGTCPRPTGTVAWCTNASGSTFNLWRVPSAATCTNPTTGKLYAQNLTSSAVFTYTAAVTDVSLAKVHADIRVNSNPASHTPSPGDVFEIVDDIVLRNSTR